MPPVHVKNNGAIKQASQVYVKDGGVWKEAQTVHVYENGQWKLVHSAGIQINTSTGYNSHTGITYTHTLTTPYSSSSDVQTVSVPSNALYMDFFMCGGGGSGGTPPSTATSNWIGSGGGAAPILYGTTTIDPNRRPSTLKCRVGKRATGRQSNGEGLAGGLSRIGATDTDTYGQIGELIVCPGGAPGRPGDGEHNRALYQPGDMRVMVPIVGQYADSNGNNFSGPSPVSYANNQWSSGDSNTGLAEGTTVNSSTYLGSNGTHARVGFPRTAMTLLPDSGGFLRASNGGGSVIYDDLCDLDSDRDGIAASNFHAHGRVLMWMENSEWKYREKQGSNSVYISTTVPPVPLYPDDVFTDSSTGSNFFNGFEVGVILAEPSERATGYAGTFRGEANASGAPQNQTFSRTTGALGSGTSLTGWSGDTPVRKGVSNTTDYGHGSDAGTSYSGGSGTNSTDGIIQIRFRSS